MSASPMLYIMLQGLFRKGGTSREVGGGEVVAEKVRRLVDCGIPVMGHIGLTPQYIHQLGGFKVRGKVGGGSQKVA